MMYKTDITYIINVTYTLKNINNVIDKFQIHVDSNTAYASVFHSEER